MPERINRIESENIKRVKKKVTFTGQPENVLIHRGEQGGAIPTKNRHTTGVFFYYVTSTKSLKKPTPPAQKQKPSL